MRFFADGPSIPDDLLERRDRGDVVFFCGAGISRPAGLPGFRDLTAKVMKKLGTPSSAKARQLFDRLSGSPELDRPEWDRIFNLLQDDYNKAEIEDVVSRILATPKRADTEPHSIILRLSRGATMRPRIVTTNFDLLFERADRSLHAHVPPALPDLASLGSFDGIVYLHGRRAPGAHDGTVARGLVLGSADFGRAYLADGWATRFVRELLKQYVLVLVGYSASDPPVRYLLEGLHARNETVERPIYAFDCGYDDDVRERWRGLGVRALPYSGSSNGSHSALWDTLRAWAQRADDVHAWRGSVIELAKKSPRQIEAHERGQVASLVRSTEGASLFAQVTPPPPAEWLCVFDRRVRYSEPERDDEGEPFDPLVAYGLDDDPPRPQNTEGDNTDRNALGDDLIALAANDERTDRHKRLAGIWRPALDPLPPRLSHLGRWYTRVLSDPVAAWWAAGYGSIHPEILGRLERILEYWPSELSDFGLRVWRLLAERFLHSPEGPHDHRWYQFRERLKRGSWTPLMLMEFERVVQPYLTTKRPWSGRFRPAANIGDASEPRHVVDFDVEFPPTGRDEVDIPVEILPTAFVIACRALHRGAILLGEIDRQHWHTVTFYPDEQPGEPYLDDASRYLHWVRELFDRLIVEYPDIAKDEVRRWPQDDDYFFDKLRIYAWAKSEVTAAVDAASGLLNLSERGFWNEYHRRELLRTLHGRWNDIDADARRHLEERILAGGDRWSHESCDDHRKRIAETAVRMLGWLKHHGCELSAPTDATLTTVRQGLAGWIPSWEITADHSLDMRGGSVATVSDPSRLLDCSLPEILTQAEIHSKKAFTGLTRFAPFDGLVEQHPRRAFVALALAARRSTYNGRFWHTLLSRWPVGTSDRLLGACAARLGRLPAATILELRYETTWWFRENVSRLTERSPQSALSLFDRLADVLLAAGDEGVRSALEERSVGGRIVARSRRTFDALNSPIGRLTNALVRILDVMKLPGGAGVPSGVADRLERLFQAPGEGAHHAASEAVVQLGWLHHLDPEWTCARLVPMLDPRHECAEAAWNGLLHDGRLPAPELFAAIKPHFLKACEAASGWQWPTDGATSRFAERLVGACYQKTGNHRYVTFAEARAALRALDDTGRAHAVWFLGTLVQGDNVWDSFGKPFMFRAWPRESRFRTPRVSRHLAFMAEQADSNFPDVVQTVLPFLVPVEQLDTTIHQAIHGDDHNSLADRFPEATLQLFHALVPDNPASKPYELGVILGRIAEASPQSRDDPRWKRLGRIAEMM